MHNPTNYEWKFIRYVMQRAKRSSSKLEERRGEVEEGREEGRKVVELVACGRCLASSLEIATAR